MNYLVATKIVFSSAKYAKRNKSPYGNFEISYQLYDLTKLPKNFAKSRDARQNRRF